MSRLTRRFFCLAVLAVSISLRAACQKTTPSTPDLPDLKVGVVGVEQPKGTTDLLAGFIPEDRVLASDQAVATFNEELMKLLKTTTHRSYVFIPKAGGADPRERNGALAHWAKIGKDMGVDLLIVPQILDWRERAGSSAGVTTSAAVNMDFYLIDVREPGGALVSRSHFKEKQVGLSDNLMNFDTVLKLVAKGLTAHELAIEGMQKIMILFPAVDIKGGQAVRLRRGRADDSTVFSDDPVAAALQWQEQGAKFLHLVDLDGAFEGVSPNTDLVRRICEALSIPVQLGGGIRDEETAHRWLDAGVARLIIGTLALEDPARFAALCHACPGRIGVSLDAENGRLKTRGWVGDTPYTVDDVVPRLAEDGAAFLVYTDIERDGMQTGVNVPALTHLARTSKVPVIAAGGVATLDDVKALYPLSVSANLEGAISGRAIYEGTLDLREAMSWIAAQER